MATKKGGKKAAKKGGTKKGAKKGGAKKGAKKDGGFGSSFAKSKKSERFK